MFRQETPIPTVHFTLLKFRIETYPQYDPLEEFRAASLDFLAKPELEVEARFFLEEEADPSEDEPLDEFAVPPKPLIELKPLPSSLRNAFLENDLESPIIISDKHTQEQTVCLMALLENIIQPLATHSRTSKELVLRFAPITFL